jgi:nucleoside-diphosphate-sugar epimerase
MKQIMSDASLHVILGGGHIEAPLADCLLSRGQRVRLIRRAPGPAQDGVEVLHGDVSDASFCADAVRGSRAVYLCLHPPDDERAWADSLPRTAENLVSAAGRAKARLVVLDHVHTLAPAAGRRIDEDAPLAPTSRQGEAGARTVRRLVEAHRRGAVAAVIARTADLYGPGCEHGVFGRAFWTPALRGSEVPMRVNLESPHTYHLVRDVAAALALLGTVEHEVLGRVFMLPCAPAAPTRRLLELMAAALGAPIVPRRLRRVHLPAVGLFDRSARDLVEMLYRWDQPLVVDDRRFRAHFPQVVPTTLEQGARETVAWALGHFGARSSGLAARRDGAEPGLRPAASSTPGGR